MKSVNKVPLIFRLSFKNIYMNRAIYGPYLFAGSFATFTFFVLSSIIYNDLVYVLPHSSYVYGMMLIGLFLLGIIMIPFLFYTHSFLLKQRKKEFALYEILGLGKGHVMLMLCFETIFVYGMVMLAGIVFGALMSKFLFLILLNLSGLPTEVGFAFKSKAFVQTGAFFLGLYGFIYVVSLRRILAATPIHLLKGSKQNDNKPKFPFIRALIGIGVMGAGYAIAVTSQVDGSIFADFFLAILFVIIGTYMFFKSGLHMLMQNLRKRKGIYYQPKNFITLSGIHQRVNKSSASLANICIFSTMVIITLLCTVSLFRGMESIHAFDHPVDATITYVDGQYPEQKVRDVKDIEATIDQLKKEYGIKTVKLLNYSYWEKRAEYNEDYFGRVRWMTKEEALKLNADVKDLQPGHVMIYSTGPNVNFETIKFNDVQYPVQQELLNMHNIPKSTKNLFSDNIYVIAYDSEQIETMIVATPQQAPARYENHYDIVIQDQEQKDYFTQGDSAQAKFIHALYEQVNQEQDVTISFSDAYEGAREVRTMSGGLLFLGLFCSVIFIVCFIIIMYYKQLAEGYDDHYNFDILQKVGMDKREVQGTILRQILVMFAIPLVFAIIHTLFGLEMIITLFATIGLYEEMVIRWSGVGVIIGYCLLYVYIYFKTSKTYYRIVAK